MEKLYYCLNCRRIGKNEICCDYCETGEMGELNIGAAVNVLETKIKGKILKIKDDKVRILVQTEGKEKLIKEYNYDHLRKVL